MSRSSSFLPSLFADPWRVWAALPPQADPLMLWGAGEDAWTPRLAWNPVERFTRFAGEFHPEEMVRFVEHHTGLGRLVGGMVSYEGGCHSFGKHGLAEHQAPGNGLPWVHLMAFPSWLEWNEGQPQWQGAAASDEEMSALIRILSLPPGASLPPRLHPHPPPPEEDYPQQIRWIQEQIRDGEVYQVNLARWISGWSDTAPRPLFAWLAAERPGGYCAYLEGPRREGGRFQVLSLSPEHFLSVEQQTVSTTPIKGTRPRGATPEEDQQLAQALEHSPKEQAELNMVTDLLRNDLGRVCQTGSVAVQPRQVRPLPTLWHASTRVTGRLAAGIGPARALLALLPGGSVTGCPKGAAVERIARLEAHPREAYTGAVGCFLPGGGAVFNLAIRTLTLIPENSTPQFSGLSTPPRWRFQLPVGAGITLLSDPQEEYRETQTKAAFLQAFVSGKGIGG
ncbi:MAG: anthranilate synthase component I family protein [Deltaproteobacteria bacterium]|nr:anthranilate synthase component I family protein [Deltaproteobacteria bacterium]